LWNELTQDVLCRGCGTRVDLRPKSQEADYQSAAG